MKIIPVEQEAANVLLELITSEALPIKASSAARVFKLQALLSTQPIEVVEQAEHVRLVEDARASALAAASTDDLEAELAIRSKETP